MKHDTSRAKSCRVKLPYVTIGVVLALSFSSVGCVWTRTDQCLKEWRLQAEPHTLLGQETRYRNSGGSVGDAARRFLLWPLLTGEKDSGQNDDVVALSPSAESTFRVRLIRHGAIQGERDVHYIQTQSHFRLRQKRTFSAHEGAAVFGSNEVTITALRSGNLLLIEEIEFTGFVLIFPWGAGGADLFEFERIR